MVILWQNVIVTPWVMMTWPPICPCSLHCMLIDGLVVAVYRPMTHRRIVMSFAAGPWTIASAVLDTPYVKVTLGNLRLEGSLAVAFGRCSSSGTDVIWPNILGPRSTDHLRTGRKLQVCVVRLSQPTIVDYVCPCKVYIHIAYSK